MLELLTSETPNGWKAAIMLEELGVPYKVTPISLTDRVQKEDWYVALNPNGRIPTLVDHDAGGFAVFESGAILIYLAEKFGRFLPADAQGRSTVIQWVMWQMAGLGPMMGQATVFNRYFEEKLPAVIDRYVRESRRLLEVMDARLATRDYLAGEYSIADIACFPWVRGADWAQIPIDGLDHLQRWRDTIAARPAVQRGLNVPEPPKPEEMEAKTVKQGRNILA
ncbi:MULTISPECIES: glutathione S-transferase N-terminal domain-containing protein [Sphingomonas]|jgi:GSH-dependent disulfide-bond oxidoreductase|uniref:glutathione S-transferase family protein n=1 Tax=Sphingomonas TaxID=13687 RepID=UPI0009297D61|nr:MULTISPECIES: glutathione S-transferase N-terminal domain-containing protein [Sphingomonas]MCW6529228.1 glutathione S-transferase N-terminal domain-containing protein [Sphingomonas lycopersici]OJU17900.1 MAG: glutathione S-transferase [Sphingomonas sp. 66-10]